METPEPNLSAGVQYFHGSYTSYFNRSHRRFGHPAVEVAKALGYRSSSSVTRAVARIESGSEQLRRTATRLEESLH